MTLDKRRSMGQTDNRAAIPVQPDTSRAQKAPLPCVNVACQVDIRSACTLVFPLFHSCAMDAWSHTSRRRPHVEPCGSAAGFFQPDSRQSACLATVQLEGCYQDAYNATGCKLCEANTRTYKGTGEGTNRSECMCALPSLPSPMRSAIHKSGCL